MPQSFLKKYFLLKTFESTNIEHGVNIPCPICTAHIRLPQSHQRKFFSKNKFYLLAVGAAAKYGVDFPRLRQLNFIN